MSKNELTAGGGSTDKEKKKIDIPFSFTTKITEKGPFKNINNYDDDDDDDDDNDETINKQKKEKNNKIVVGLAVKPTEKINSKGYSMNSFDIFTVYNSLPYSTVDNVDDFLKNFFKFIQTKHDDNGKIKAYDNNEHVEKKDITYIVVDPVKYFKQKESGKDKDSNSDDGDKTDVEMKPNKQIRFVKNGVLSGGKKTRKTSKKSRKTKKSQKSKKSQKNH